MKRTFTVWGYLDSIYSPINTKVLRCILILLLVTVFQAHTLTHDEPAAPNQAQDSVDDLVADINQALLSAGLWPFFVVASMDFYARIVLSIKYNGHL